MIRNAFLHLLGEQPLLVDLPEVPGPTDIVLVCTNVRTTNGKRPRFVEDGDATFVFPYAQIRFVEVPPAPRTAIETALATAAQSSAAAGDQEVLELDEDFLRRVRDV